LVNHLNANAAYYTNLIFMAGDAAVHYSILAANGLADIAENAVIGTIGPYVALPLKSADLMPPPYNTSYSIPDFEAERLITLPTPGVFAEAQMGSCSACETIDQTTFWDWQKSPTPENAPDISAAMLASRFQDLSSMTLPTQSNLQAPPVQIPTEPAPLITIGDNTMAALVSNLQLSNANDVASLVKDLVSAASQGYKNLINAQQGSPGMTAPGAGGGNGTGVTGGGNGGNLVPSDTAVVPTDAITAV